MTYTDLDYLDLLELKVFDFICTESGSDNKWKRFGLCARFLFLVYKILISDVYFQIKYEVQSITDQNFETYTRGNLLMGKNIFSISNYSKKLL